MSKRWLALILAVSAAFQPASAYGTSKPCAKGPVSHKVLTGRAERALDEGKAMLAGQSWAAAAEVYPACSAGNLGLRMRDIQRALDAYALAVASTVVDRAQCEDPYLAATRMLVRQRRDLQQLAPTVMGAQRRLDEVDGHLKSREPTSHYTAEVLEGVRAPGARSDLAQLRDAYTAAVARFPGCAAPLRDYLIQTTLQSISIAPARPSCGEKDELARAELERVIKALGAAEPGASPAPGIELLQMRLTGYQALGAETDQALASAANASTANDHQRAAGEYAKAFHALPECNAYHQARGDALSRALNSLAQVDGRRALEQAIALIEEAQKSWSVAYGERARQRPAVGYFEARKRKLVKALERPDPPRPLDTSPPPSAGKGDRGVVNEGPKEPGPLNTTPLAPTRVSGPVLGMVIGVGATVAFSLAAGVLTSRVRRGGPIYTRIVDAYDAARINHYIESDLCDPATHAGEAGIVAACGQHASLKHGAIALWSLGAAAAITMAVFAGLTARAGRPASTGRRAALGLVPNRTGVMLDLRLDF